MLRFLFNFSDTDVGTESELGEYRVPADVNE